jgi:nucleoside-diphosphate-sugar epimerase
MNQPWRDTRVLIVGGAGFVGANLAKKLLEEDVKAINVVDNFLSSEPENIPESSGVTLLEGSIAADIILDQIDDKYDYIFHLATYHGNQSSIHDPLADHENNLLTTLRLFNHIRDFKRVRKVVYSGAGCAVAKKTFDQAEATSEDAPMSLEMDSPYSISKIVGEFYAVYFNKQHGLPTVRARFQNVYGPGEILGAGKWRGTPATIWRNVTPTFIYKALKGQALPIENEGIATRDFIYVDDVVDGLLSCALKGRGGDVYNIASGVETSIKELAQTVNELTGNMAPVQHLPKRDWDTSGKRFGSTDKAKREFGFEAKVSLGEGLSRTIGWTRITMPFIEACIQKHANHMAEYS